MQIIINTNNANLPEEMLTLAREAMQGDIQYGMTAQNCALFCLAGFIPRMKEFEEGTGAILDYVGMALGEIAAMAVYLEDVEVGKRFPVRFGSKA